MKSLKYQPPNWSQITGIFGGRFDPPHLGHQEAIDGLFTHPGIKQVMIIPSAAPPHKPAWATADQRADMAFLNFITENSSFSQEIQIDLRELTRSRLRPDQPSYSFDTLEELRPLFHKQLAFIMGSDEFDRLSTWYRFPEILGLCHWIVLLRKPKEQTEKPQIELEKALSTLQSWSLSGLVKPTPQADTWQLGNQTLVLVPTQAPPISSTEIRKTLVKSGIPPENTLSEKVKAYLKLHGLYGIR